MDYAMFTKRGNQRVGSLVGRLVRARNAGMAEEQMFGLFREGYLKIEHGHTEITDTAVREALDEALVREGFSEAFSHRLVHCHPMYGTAE